MACNPHAAGVLIFIRAEANIACDVKVRSTGRSQSTDKAAALRAAALQTVCKHKARRFTYIPLLAKNILVFQRIMPLLQVRIYSHLQIPQLRNLGSRFRLVICPHGRSPAKYPRLALPQYPTNRLAHPDKIYPSMRSASLRFPNPPG